MNNPTNQPSGLAAIKFQPRLILIAYSLLAGLEGLVVAGLLAGTPIVTRTSLVIKSAMLAGVILGIALVGAPGVLSWRNPAWAGRIFEKIFPDRWKKAWLIFFGALFLLGWVGCFLPDYRIFPNQAAYFQRLQWIIAWLTLLAGQSGIALALSGNAIFTQSLKAQWQAEGGLLKTAAFTFGVFVLVWAGMVLTRVGLTPDDRFWNEAGVPVLGLQVLLAWIASLGAALLLFRRAGPEAEGSKKRFLSGWKLDLLVCAILWAAGAYFWSQTPMPRSYYAPGPYPPNYVFYPYSDAAVYDTGAQYVLIGQGLNDNQYFDKPFYLLFLALLHMAAGQDYLPVVQLQAVCLALFPALLYLTGKSLHSRTAGLLIGILAVIEETNAIEATLKIQVSTSRLMLTEVPTAFGMVLFSLVFIEWLKRPRARLPGILLAGGVLGTLVLTRTTTLILAPFLLVVIVMALKRQWRRGLAAGSLFLVGLALVVGPWFVTNRTPDGRIFIAEKLRAVFETRYDDIGPVASPVVSPNATQPAAANPTNLPTASPPAFLQTPGAASPAPAQPAPGTAQPPGILQAINRAASLIQSAMQFAPAHFFHNIALSPLILPLSLQYDDLNHTLDAAYWSTNWNGYLPPDKVIFLVINLLVIALGIGAATQFHKLAGWIPLVMLVVYHFSNGLGRTSGARYLVPVDWVVLFYFGVGLVQFSAWGATLLRVRQEPASTCFSEGPTRASGRRSVVYGLLIAAGLILTGLCVILVGKLYPIRYAPQAPSQLLADTLAQGSLQKAGVKEQEAANFIASGGTIFQGRLLYPRFYKIGQGEPTSKIWTTFGIQNYGRMIFQVIGPVSKLVVLPLRASPEGIPDAADVTVIGCTVGNDVQAQALIIQGSPDVVYLGAPAASWSCPLPVPVCDANGACN